MGESLSLAGSTLLPEWCRCSSLGGSSSVLAEPSEIEAPQGEDSIRLANVFWGRYMRYTATSPGRGRCPRRWAAGRRGSPVAPGSCRTVGSTPPPPLRARSLFNFRRTGPDEPDRKSRDARGLLVQWGTMEVKNSDIFPAFLLGLSIKACQFTSRCLTAEKVHLTSCA